MTDLNLLQKAIADSGMSITVIARRSKLSRETFYNKIKGKSEFKVSEMEAVSNVLGLDEKTKSEIFFANRVN